MKKNEQGYLEVMKEIMETGHDRSDRTGIGTKAILGSQISFDLTAGFPLLTTKNVWFKGVASELLWMLSGSTNVNDLPQDVQKWWTPWASSDGSLGPTYGHQYRKIVAKDGSIIDQVSDVIDSIKTNPFSRRHIITLWDAEDNKQCNLPPCHGSIIQFFFFFCKLSCQTYCRSQDWFIGTPVNIAAYALLTHMIARLTNLNVGQYIHTTGDTHIYANHHNQVQTQMSRSPYDFPQIEITGDQKTIDDFKLEDFKIINYKRHDKIEAPIAV